MDKGLDKKLRTVKDFLDKTNYGVAIIGDLSESRKKYLKQAICKNPEYCVKEVMISDRGSQKYAFHITKNNNTD